MTTRVSSKPITVPNGVKINIEANRLMVTGQKGSLEQALHHEVDVTIADNVLKFAAKTKSKQAYASAGSLRALTQNMINGVMEGFKKELNLIGVGYRAAAQGDKLNLTLGFSHPVVLTMPKGITVETPTQTQIVVKGVDKQLVGQVAANIRRLRLPEPYKGKGVCYSDERVKRKETKKK